MYSLGERRSETFSPRAMRSRSRCRIFSRSMATAFIRLPSESVTNKGMASVITVAIAATAANTIVMVRGLETLSMRMSIMASEIEVDHFAHDEDAAGHPAGAACEHETAGGRGPQQLDVEGARNVDQEHHRHRQAGDDRGGGLGLHRHGLDLGL